MHVLCKKIHQFCFSIHYPIGAGPFLILLKQVWWTELYDLRVLLGYDRIAF